MFYTIQMERCHWINTVRYDETTLKYYCSNTVLSVYQYYPVLLKFQYSTGTCLERAATRPVNAVQSMKLTYIVGLRQSVRRGAPHRGWSCTRVGVDYNSIIGDYDYGYDAMFFFYSSNTIYLIILICHDNGVVQHKLQKIFASTIIYRVQTMLSFKKTCYDNGNNNNN